MVQHRCGGGQANGEPRQSLVTLGPGLAIALPPVGRHSTWAERDDGVRKLADIARGEAMCGKEESEHLLVMLVHEPVKDRVRNLHLRIQLLSCCLRRRVRQQPHHL